MSGVLSPEYRATRQWDEAQEFRTSSLRLLSPNNVPCRRCLTRSQINMAIAMRMATLMQLHREETYVIPSPTQELIIRAESARRTLVRGLDMNLGESSKLTAHH